MSVELKVKSKTLEAESKIIRKEVAKSKKQYRYYRDKQDARKARAANFRTERLAVHRRREVRNEARRTFIARAFLRGGKFSDVAKRMKPGDQYHVVRMIYKYGDFKSEFDARGKFIAWKALTL